MNNIFVLLGPTASGKSNLSYQLADNFDFEIINADLFSIYKYLNIGTAKPSKDKFKNYKHYLFDKLEPDEQYNVSNYCFDVSKIINDIHIRGKMPLIVGGSMMYVFQLLNGLSNDYELSDGDSNLINFIQSKYNNEQILKSISDYRLELTYKIDTNDSYRVEKLLERLISKEKNPHHSYKGLYRLQKYNIKILFIDVSDRETLKESIKKRTQKMIDTGLVGEVENLKKYYNLTDKNQSMRAIGYKETLKYIDKKIDINELLTSITVATQQLAKRQITWKNKFKINYPIMYPKHDYVNLSKYISQSIK